MPLEIKNKKTGEVLACAVVCESLECGHCLLPIEPVGAYLALDDPYFCVIHETCMSLFNFNKLSRRRTDSAGRIQAKKELDDIQSQLHTMISRPWWQKNAPKHYQKAMQELLMLHQSLRTARVIKDPVIIAGVTGDSESVVGVDQPPQPQPPI